jgi:monofunctional biosynthetic peptidoglycan transglycosylase
MIWLQRRSLAAAAAGAAVLLGVAVEPLLGLPSATTMRAEIVGRYPPDAARSWKPLVYISSALQIAVLAWEDPGFHHHAGISYPDLFEALKENIRQRRYARGGSTITQQVVKNLFLSREKTLRRKWQEMVLARRLETVLSKDEILEVYLNIADWGNQVHGAEAAARFYFGRSAAELDVAQSATLAAILPNPHVFNPCLNPVDARRRRNRVLDILLEDRALTGVQHQAAMASPVTVSCSHETRIFPQRAESIVPTAGR